MTPLFWVLVAAAVLCWPSRDAPVVPVRRRAQRRRGRRAVGAGPTSRLAALGAVAAGGLLVAIIGPSALPVAILVAPRVARLGARLERDAGSGPDSGLPLALDLAAAALRSGQPVSQALRLSAPVTAERTGSALARVAGLLELGSEPRQAWASVELPALSPVASAARRSADSGARLADGFEQVADDLRREARAAAVARGQRAGVLAMAPLGLCFLPAFICLGVVPVVVGIAGAAFGHLQ